MNSPKECEIKLSEQVPNGKVKVLVNCEIMNNNNYYIL